MKKIIQLTVIALLLVTYSGEPVKEALAATPTVVNKAQSENAPTAEQTTQDEPQEQPKRELTTKQTYMQQAGISESDWGYVDYIITHESSWNPSAVNYLGCIGLYQACPSGNKPVLVSKCPDWQKNIVCSLQEAASYAIARYGSWSEAYSFWQANHWW